MCFNRVHSLQMQAGLILMIERAYWTISVCMFVSEIYAMAKLFNKNECPVLEIA